MLSTKDAIKAFPEDFPLEWRNHESKKIAYAELLNQRWAFLSPEFDGKKIVIEVDDHDGFMENFEKCEKLKKEIHTLDEEFLINDTKFAPCPFDIESPSKHALIRLKLQKTNRIATIEALAISRVGDVLKNMTDFHSMMHLAKLEEEKFYKETNVVQLREDVKLIDEWLSQVS